MRGRARERRGRAALCEKWEVNGAAIGSVTDTRRMRVLRDGELRRRHVRARAGGRLPAVRPRTRRSPPQPIYPPPAATLAHGAAPASACSHCCLSEHRLAPAAVRAVRLDRAVAHGPPPRAGRRGGARAPRRRARWRVSIDCNGRRVAADPYRGHARGGARVRREPRLRGRRAAGNDQQPQLRQPREAAYRVAADRGGARPRRGLQRARRADRRRQRLALQRGRDRPDLPDPGDRHGRPAARRLARRAPGLRRRGRGDRARRPLHARRSPPASSPSCAASRCRTACRVDLDASRRAQSRSARRCAPARSRAPTTSPRAASRSRWPSAAWPAAWARASSWRDRSRPMGLFGEGPGGFVVSGRAGRARAARRAGAAARDRHASAARHAEASHARRRTRRTPR